MNDGSMLCRHLLRPAVANPQHRGLDRGHPRYPVHQRVAVARVAIRGRHLRTVHVCQCVLESVIEDQTWGLLLLLIVIRFNKGGASGRDDRIAVPSLFPRLNNLLLLHHYLWWMLSRTLLHRDVDIVLT